MLKSKVLFLCTGNSCRSQMAEGFVSHLPGDRFEAYSAGLEPSTVNPNAIKVMHEVGIDISRHRSKHVSELIDIPFDIVVTVCDNARENCPLFPGTVKVLHIGFPDPATATGSENEILQFFRKVRDDIKDRIPRLLDENSS